MKATLLSIWRLFHALAFYPILIGVFIWLYLKGAHWIYGLAVIAIILIFDPMWRMLAANVVKIFTKK